MKVMIRAPNWVGDAVMAVPALGELRRIFANAEITLVAREWVAGLFEGEGLADRVTVPCDGRGPTTKAWGFFRDARRLRKESFDFAVLLQNAFGAALLARAGGVRKIAGYPTDRRRFLLDVIIPLSPDHRTTHQVLYYLNIASQLERELNGSSRVGLEDPQPRLHVGRDELEQARARLAECGIKTDPGRDRVLAINPGATNSRAKRWPAERFARTADRFAVHDGFQTVIVGAPGDLDAARETANQMRTPVATLAGKTTISELKGVLACASLVISNDTGAAHVSAALGVPTVVVFGPTEHFSTRPYSDLAAVVRHDVECSPCMLRDCPIDHRCMTRVEVDDVYDAAQRLLAGVPIISP